MICIMQCYNAHLRGVMSQSNFSMKIGMIQHFLVDISQETMQTLIISYENGKNITGRRGKNTESKRFRTLLY